MRYQIADNDGLDQSQIDLFYEANRILQSVGKKTHSTNPLSSLVLIGARLTDQNARLFKVKHPAISFLQDIENESFYLIGAIS